MTTSIERYDIAALVRDFYGVIETASTTAEMLKQMAGHMKRVLGDPEILARDYGLPIQGDFVPRFIYRDPQYLFAIHASMMPPGEQTGVHDHGETWVVQGVLHNSLRTIHYDRFDDGSVPGHFDVRERDTIDSGPGDIDILMPGGLHQNANVTDELTLSIIVHGRDLNTIWRNFYDQEGKRLKRVKTGPSPLPAFNSHASSDALGQP